MNLKKDFRFKGIEPFEKKIWLASPTMHGDEEKWVADAFSKNWITTAGENVNECEQMIADHVGCKYSVALSCGTSAIHLAIRLAGEKLYGQPMANRGALLGHKVFCSDLTFAATVNPISYENGEAIFIDSERETWNMDPIALEKAFEAYPDVKLVVLAHLYGTPAKLDEIKAVCKKSGAILIEDAAESLGATYQNRQTGAFGDLSIVSFNGNKIITGSSGGMLLTDNKEDADKIRKWSTQSRENAPWYQHENLGFNYRMSNIIAGIVRGQIPHLHEHIAKKKKIYLRYKDGFGDMPVSMNPYDSKKSEPNYWLSCIMLDSSAMCNQARSNLDYAYASEIGKSSPHEILDALASFNAEGRPIWKPMHLQPLYSQNPFVSSKGVHLASDIKADTSVSTDIFGRGLCLPSDIKMTEAEQDKIIDIVCRCFR